MKTPILALGLAVLAVVRPALAQQFDPGSDGSLGDYTTTKEMQALQVPPDGVMRFRSFRVMSDQTVLLVPNQANTPVHILASGEIVILGTLQLSGAAASGISGGTPGPGGFRGGNGVSDAQLPGAGHGPGGGLGSSGPSDNGSTQFLPGAAGFRYHPENSRGVQNGAAYGSATLIPLVGGSGGGGSWSGGGGGGGGAVLLASGVSFVCDGTIRATGGYGTDGNGGSGGAIRIVAPTITGAGTLDVRGGTAASVGRIRLDAFNASVGNLNTPGTSPAVGSLMLTGLNLPGAPRLSVLQVGAVAVTPGASGTVSVTLPAGSNPAQSITVEAVNFGRKVPISVALIPDHGPRQNVAAEVDNSAGGTTRASVPVTFPVNVTTRVSVWTR